MVSLKMDFGVFYFFRNILNAREILLDGGKLFKYGVQGTPIFTLEPVEAIESFLDGIQLSLFHLN